MVNWEDIARSNPWWGKGKDFFYLDKDIQKLLQNQSFQINRQTPQLKTGNVYVLKGPRRVGKTVWLKLLVKDLLEKEKIGDRDILYYSFEKIHKNKELWDMLENFLSRVHSGTVYLLLDELQYVEKWDDTIKHLYDSGVLKNVVTIITGSISSMLRQPGRGNEGNVYIMRTLGFSDFCAMLLNEVHGQYGVNRINQLLGYYFTNDEAMGLESLIKKNKISLEEDVTEIYKKADSLAPYAEPITKMFDIYLSTGGYPMSIDNYLIGAMKRVGEQDASENARIYEEIYNYAQRDAATLAGSASGDSSKAAKVIDSTLEHLGSRISYLRSAKSLEMNQVTYINYFHRLENSYAFVTIKAVDKNLDEMQVRKVYFSDIVIHYSVGAAKTGEEPRAYISKLLDSSEVGKIIEEVVASHLVKTKEHDPMKSYSTYLKFYYSRTSQREIDFIYKRNSGTALAIEVKYQNHPETKDIYKVDSVKDYLLLTRNKFEMAGNTALIPVAPFLALLEKSRHNL